MTLLIPTLVRQRSQTNKLDKEAREALTSPLAKLLSSVSSSGPRSGSEKLECRKVSRLLLSGQAVLAFSFFVFFVFLPEPTGKETRIRYSQGLPEDLMFGSLHVFPFDPDVQSITINRQKPALYKNRWIFSTGFEENVAITGLMKSEGEIIWFDDHYISIVPKIERAQNLVLPSSSVSKLAKVSPEQRRHEREIIWAFYRDHSGKIESLCHMIPVDNIMTSPFGKPRRLSSGVQYFHSGVDLRAQTGVPIVSSGLGTVVYRKFHGVTGNTMVIRHGAGLYTSYFHLSEFVAPLGLKVDRGELIGLAGATGRVTAAHLHWEVIFRGKKIDPLRFLETVKSTCPQ